MLPVRVPAHLDVELAGGLGGVEGVAPAQHRLQSWPHLTPSPGLVRVTVHRLESIRAPISGVTLHALQGVDSGDQEEKGDEPDQHDGACHPYS